MIGIVNTIRKAVRRSGWDIIRYVPGGHPLARREMILQQYGINVVFDVGANIGEYGKELRDINYRGKILSFEPLIAAYEKLVIAANKDDQWDVYNYALGDIIGKVKINIAGNSYSSSIMDMLPTHLHFAPDSKYVGEQITDIKTIDSIFPTICHHGDGVYLKIDTQGFEKKVLDGAINSLPRIDTIQIEISLIPLYQEGPLFDEMYGYLTSLGYSIISLAPAFTDEKSGRMLQVDAIFHRF